MEGKTSLNAGAPPGNTMGPTMPVYEIYNPAVAQFNADHPFSIAEYDVMKGDGAEAAIDKAFKRAEEIFAKYQIVQG